MADIYSVSHVTKYLRDLIEKDQFLTDLWLRGEISNWKHARSGHCYFTLKDGSAEIRCVMWKSTAQQMSVLPRNGEEIVAHGRISIYIQRGAYQFYVDEMQPIGQGVLYQRFEELKMKLASEGLFDDWMKKALPTYPRRIGIVSSPTAAALQDILNVLRRRYPVVEVVLSPTLVQGHKAPENIVRALAHFDEMKVKVDVVIVARGGGSIEDLWAFNEEIVARAIHRCAIPVITGVGHEVDFTIADFVADRRAPTPSAAAELVVPDIRELRDQLRYTNLALHDVMDRELSDRRQALKQEVRALEQLSPEKRLQEQRQGLDNLSARLELALTNQLQLKRSSWSGLQGRLANLDPRATIARGYAIVADQRSGTLVRRARDVVPSQTLRVTVEEGEFKATVNGVRGTEWMRG
ncbi:MAG: exodeoxyribonuclease VII large subunit [Ardenticatenaceae bacterium]